MVGLDITLAHPCAFVMTLESLMSTTVIEAPERGKAAVQHGGDRRRD
jgi:hypothetical protein